MKKLLDNINIAFIAIRMNLLRAILTMCIIAFGIMALIGMLTALEGLKSNLVSKFSDMGANSFVITPLYETFISGGHGRQRSAQLIEYRQAQRFRDHFKFSGNVSISYDATGSAILKTPDEKTNPNINVKAIDENYLAASGMQVKEGRNFTAIETEYGNNLVIIGKALRDQLFGNREALGQNINIGSYRFRVVGVLEEKGSTMGMTLDKDAYIPVNAARPIFPDNNKTYEIKVTVAHQGELNMAVEEATGIFRIIRRLNVGRENDFTITRSDSLARSLSENLSFLQVAAFVIGLMTLLGAVIGLMNIMLVSVTERTKEIGTRKAIGATTADIRNQFLMEAIVIGQVGGLAGIGMGLLLGNFVSMAIGGSFIVPWVWVITGFLLCFVVGITAGLLPALKAARENPIEALRYE
ncbi:MAG: ABC transporter permease [Bacteroidia bacterium]